MTAGDRPPRLAGQPFAGEEPVFRAPWEAHAFALAVSLHEQGLFTWPEWAAALGAQFARAQASGDADLGDTYYAHWLAALEGLCRAKGAVSPSELDARAEDWRRAYEHTPHGQPVELAAAYRTP